MSQEFRVQYIESVIAASSATTILDAGNGDFTHIDDDTRTMLLPAGSWHHTAALGWNAGNFEAAMRNSMVSADLGADNTLTFARGNAGLGSVRAGVNVIEYIGPNGGANEFIRRSKQTVTLASASLTVDSAAISGVVSFAKLLPIVFIRSDANSNDYRHGAVKVDIIDTAGTYTVRLTRAASTGTITALVYVYELTGANWLNQRVAASITVAATKQDQTISAVTAATAFVVRTFQENSSPSGPSALSPLVWISAATTLSARAPTISATSYVAFVVSNPSMAVQLLAAPDGVTDWAAGAGSAEQSQALSFSSVDLSRACIVGQAGSEDTTAANHTSELWLFKLTSATVGTARRGRSFGATEHVVQVIEWPQDLPNLTGISATIRTGGTVVLDGTKLKPAGVAPTVTMRGSVDSATLSLSASSDTQITANVAIGTQIFESKEFIVTTTIGTASLNQTVLPPSGETYFNLAGGLNSTGVPTAIPDIVDTTQFWCKNLKDSSAVTKDVTDTALYRVLPNGVTELDSSIAVSGTGAKVDMAANNNNGAGWSSTFTTITINTNVVAPTTQTIPDLILAKNVSTQFDLAPYAAGEETVILLAPLPDGLDMATSNGFVSGSPTVTGSFTVPLRFTNDGGSTDSSFSITVIGEPDVWVVPSDLQFTTHSGLQIIDFTGYFGGAQTYGIEPQPPAEWDFQDGILTIDPVHDGTFGPFIVSGTNEAGTVYLVAFTVTITPFSISQIALSTPSRRINEGSSMVITATFRNRSTSETAVPTNVKYRLDGEHGQITGWTDVIASTVATITLSPAQTAIINNSRSVETRVLSVAADYGLATQYIEPMIFQVRNRPYS